jgi:hypothetical protein
VKEKLYGRHGKESHSVAERGRQPPRDARQYPPATFRSRRRSASGHGLSLPGGREQSGIQLYPVSGKKSAAAAQTAGLTPSSISTLLVEGDNRSGLGHAIAKAIGDAGINMSFVMAQVMGRRYSALFGFENEADASKAATLIKRATARGRK